MVNFFIDVQRFVAFWWACIQGGIRNFSELQPWFMVVKMASLSSGNLFLSYHAVDFNESFWIWKSSTCRCSRLFSCFHQDDSLDGCQDYSLSLKNSNPSNQSASYNDSKFMGIMWRSRWQPFLNYFQSAQWIVMIQSPFAGTWLIYMQGYDYW